MSSRKSGDFPDSFAQWKPSCSPVYLFALLIAGHTSYVTSPQILQVNLSLTRGAGAAAAGHDNLGRRRGEVEQGYQPAHKQAREQAQSHILTHADEVIQMVGITAAVWPLMAC